MRGCGLRRSRLDQGKQKPENKYDGFLISSVMINKQENGHGSAEGRKKKGFQEFFVCSLEKKLKRESIWLLL